MEEDQKTSQKDQEIRNLKGTLSALRRMERGHRPAKGSEHHLPAIYRGRDNAAG